MESNKRIAFGGAALFNEPKVGPGYGFAIQVSQFCRDRFAEFIGHLTRGDRKAGITVLRHTQVAAWEEELEILHRTLSEIQKELPESGDWVLVVEFDIPRRGKRADVVLLASDAIVVIEFKVHAKKYHLQDQRQVEDYAMELSDFHAGSLDRRIIPILVATDAQDGSPDIETSTDLVWPVICCNASQLISVLVGITRLAEASRGPATDPLKWLESPYRPTPSIIEAAQCLYANHDVKAISRADAAVQNLTATQDAIVRAVEDARSSSKKIVCFVTGVPGAGKTLAGLNAVCRREREHKSSAVFLSGNGPLVKVLVEALAKGEASRLGVTLKQARRHSSTFVQNVHRFISHYLQRPDELPDCHIAVFDEAQRAWDSDQSRRKFQRGESEPASMLRIMDRHSDWAVIVGLVGGGQEINTGEAGLREWGRALAEIFPNWEIRVSSALLHGDTSTVGQTLFERNTTDVANTVKCEEELHLSVPTRTYRSTNVAEWVNQIIKADTCAAASTIEGLKKYPIYLTRSLDARAWLRMKQRGFRRAGIVASSGARRLRPLGIDVQTKIGEAEWFLAAEGDVRSSSFLELAATEFQIQGLELDWVAICWGADLRGGPDGWSFHSFKGTRWQCERKEQRQQYLLNKYRVLLTRAREGMVIWVPGGDNEDKTRCPEFYDGTARLLQEAGVQLLPADI